MIPVTRKPFENGHPCKRLNSCVEDKLERSRPEWT